VRPKELGRLKKLIHLKPKYGFGQSFMICEENLLSCAEATPVHIILPVGFIRVDLSLSRKTRIYRGVDLWRLLVLT
jgi:hypothetical protein